MKIKTIKDIKKFVESKNKSTTKIGAEEVLDMLDDLIEKKIAELGRDKIRYEKVKVKIVKKKNCIEMPVMINGYQIAALKELLGY
jgi:hypothetical protein